MKKARVRSVRKLRKQYALRLPRSDFDVLKAVFALLGAGTVVDARAERLHRAWGKLCGRYPKLLSGFKPDERGSYPYYSELDHGVWCLRMADHLGYLDRGHSSYGSFVVLRKAVVNFHKHVSSKFSNRELKELMAASMEFRSLVVVEGLF